MTTKFLPLLSVLLLALPGTAAPKRARNVILLLADAGGVATVNAASVLGYNAPRKLFIQSWQNVGLSDTTPAERWVSDSAAGMTAIVTGVKTQNGVISLGPDTERGKRDGAMLKTILEHAEERGLSTGVLSNVTITDATPAACFSHVNNRSKFGEIFMQLLEPRFGNGVDVLIGLGRDRIFPLVEALGQKPLEAAKAKGREIFGSLAEAGDFERALVIASQPVDLAEAARKTIRALSRNKKGYFLMIESDAHTDDPAAGLGRLVAFDKLIRELAATAGDDTLFLFTADHSFDLRIVGGGPGEPLLAGLDEWKQKRAAALKANPKEPRQPVWLPSLRVEGRHTGEEVIVAARGPGAERVKGFLANTDLFHIMMAAFGWSR